jgi:hypothetical protein
VTELSLYFTRHALNRMRWLKVTPPAIEAIIRAPTSRMSDREPPRVRLFGSLPDGRRVRVVAVEEENRIVIVTIIDEER